MQASHVDCRGPLASEAALIRCAPTPPKKTGSSRVLSVTLVTTPRLPPPPPFNRPESVRICAGIGGVHCAIACEIPGGDNISGISGRNCVRARRGGPSIYPPGGLRGPSLVADPPLGNAGPDVSVS